LKLPYPNNGFLNREQMPDNTTVKKARDGELDAGQILVAFEKLFGGGRGVKKFARSGLRYVELSDGAILVEQNPKKKSKWAELARNGQRVAWVLKDGEFLARVIDGGVTLL
jgi:ribosomal protein L24E